MQEGLARNLPDWPWGAGSRRAGSVTRRRRRLWRAKQARQASGHKALLYSMDRAAGWLGGVGGRRRGPQCPRAPAPAGYGTGAALSITALVAGAESILHDRPGTKQSRVSRAGLWVAGAREFLASGLAERSAGASTRAAGAAARPTRSGACPEARQTLSFISQRQSAGLSATRQRAARGCPG